MSKKNLAKLRYSAKNSIFVKIIWKQVISSRICAILIDQGSHVYQPIPLIDILMQQNKINELQQNWQWLLPLAFLGVSHMFNHIFWATEC